MEKQNKEAKQQKTSKNYIFFLFLSYYFKSLIRCF